MGQVEETRVKVYSKDVELLYNKAIMAFQLGEYGKSYMLFKEVHNKEPKHPNIRSFLGLSLSRIGIQRIRDEKYEGAVHAFKRALEYEPDNTAYFYYLGLIYYKTGDYDRSKEHLGKVILNDPASEMAKKSLNLREKMAGKEGKRVWSVGYGIGYQQDSNVILKAESVPLPEEIKNQDDFRFVITLWGEFFPFSLTHLESRIRYMFYQSIHSELEGFNLQNHSPTADLTVTGGPFSLTGGYDFQYSLLSNDLEGFQASHVPRADMALTFKRSSTSLGYRYRIDDFMEEVGIKEKDSRDATAHIFEFKEGILFSKGKGMVQFPIRYTRNDAEGIDFQYEGIEAGLNIILPLFWKFALNLGGRYGFKDYPNHTEGRRDHLLNWSAGLIGNFLRYLRMDVGYMGSVNFSEAENYEYDRTILSVTLSGSF